MPFTYYATPAITIRYDCDEKFCYFNSSDYTNTLDILGLAVPHADFYAKTGSCVDSLIDPIYESPAVSTGTDGAEWT